MRGFMIVVLGVALAAAACQGDPSERAGPGDRGEYVLPAVEVTEADRREASRIYHQRCVQCHGEAGAGDGPAALQMAPRPRDYRDADWQGAVGDRKLADVIVRGGRATGMSFLMPANPDLADRPEVVRAMVDKIRAFAHESDA